MLEAAGARVVRRPSSASVDPAERLRLERIDVPGDFSSAAPLLVAAAVVPGSDLTVHGVGLNPRRTGLLDVLERMGARIAVYNRHRAGNEPVGDVEIRAAAARGHDRRPPTRCRCSSTSCRSSRSRWRTRAATAGSRARRSCA